MNALKSFPHEAGASSDEARERLQSLSRQSEKLSDTELVEKLTSLALAFACADVSGGKGNDTTPGHSLSGIAHAIALAKEALSAAGFNELSTALDGVFNQLVALLPAAVQGAGDSLASINDLSILAWRWKHANSDRWAYSDGTPSPERLEWLHRFGHELQLLQASSVMQHENPDAQCVEPGKAAVCEAV